MAAMPGRNSTRRKRSRLTCARNLLNLLVVVCMPDLGYARDTASQQRGAQAHGCQVEPGGREDAGRKAVAGAGTHRTGALQGVLAVECRELAVDAGELVVQCGG